MVRRKAFFNNIFEFTIAFMILYFFIPYSSEITDFEFCLAKDKFIQKFKEIRLLDKRINQTAIFDSFIGGSINVDIPVDVTRDSIVCEAKNYVGLPFIWGGSSEDGVDCSGLTYLVYKKNNIIIPRTAGEQYKLGDLVFRDELKKGDLVFFRTKSLKASHVGIYIGDGLFIHSFTCRTGVIISSIDKMYYERRFIGGKSLF